MPRDTLTRVLALAARAPSGANGQPWHFEWNGQELFVYFARRRTPSRVDSVDFRGTWVLIGAFLECLEIAASTEALAVQFVTGMPYQEDRPCLRVVFAPGPRDPLGLSAALAERYTDRRLFKGGNIGDAVFQEAAETWRVSGHGRIHYLSPFPRPLVDYITNGEGMAFEWPELFRELWSWWRWSNHEAETTRDGMYWPTLGVNYLSSRVLKQLGTHPASVAVANRIGVRAIQSRKARRAIESSAALALLTMPGLEIHDAFEFGRTMMRVWLQFQRAGYSVGIYGHCAMYQYFRATNSLVGDFPAQHEPWLESGARILKDSFRHGDHEWPFLVWRIGRCPGPLPAAMRTLRRDVSALIRWTDHQG